MAEFVVMPAIVMGLAIGLYEALLIHRDVKVATHRMAHTAHALGFAIIAVFVTMNTAWILQTFSFLKSIPLLGTPIVLQILVGVIAMVKIHGASAAIKTTVGGGSVGFNFINLDWGGGHQPVVGGDRLQRDQPRFGHRPGGIGRTVCPRWAAGRRNRRVNPTGEVLEFKSVI